MANGHGGARPNSGNKPKQDFEKTNNIFLTAIKQVKDVNTDDEARIELAKDLLTFERGKIFISEHIFGKATERIESDVNVTGMNLKDIISFGSPESEI
jgi:hypothetical protein